MAPLQRRALYSLIVGLALSIAFAAVLITAGDVTAFEDNFGLRLVMYAAMVGVPLAYLILVSLTLRRPSQVDERDLLILGRSSHIQWLAVIFSLAAWTVTLTEVYRESGKVPAAFLNLIFVSVLIISILAQSAGILLGYWSMNRNG